MKRSSSPTMETVISASLFLALMATTVAFGLLGIAVVRYLFLAGAAGLGWWFWRIGPERHLQTAVALFAFAPFLRRVVDWGCGYDASGLMLAGPLLAIAVPGLDVPEFAKRATPIAPVRP